MVFVVAIKCEVWGLLEVAQLKLDFSFYLEMKVQ